MTPFSSNCLFGKDAFFTLSSYTSDLKKEFNTFSSCSYQSSQKIKKNNKQLSDFYPPLLGYLFKRITKRITLPAVKSPSSFGSRLIKESGEWKYKRITVLVDGLFVDAAIMGRASTLNNKKWVLASIGRTQTYEKVMTDKTFQSFLKDINSNVILFNYPNIGASKGTRNTKNMVAAYKGILEFLEDDKKGIGAKKIIGYGYSMGGGVQGEALKTHNFKQDIQYLFIKDRTFSNLRKIFKSYSKGILNDFGSHFGWSLDSLESSKRLEQLKIPEIIIQATDEGNNPISDGVISKNASLKQAALTASLQHKTYINFSDHKKNYLHEWTKLSDFSQSLSQKINELMQTR